MAGNSVVRARIDARTKREAAAALKKIGLSVSDAFRLLLVRVAAEKALPFEPLNPNAETVAFEVEFSGNEGRTYATLALRSDQLMVLHHAAVEVA